MGQRGRSWRRASTRAIGVAVCGFALSWGGCAADPEAAPGGEEAAPERRAAPATQEVPGSGSAQPKRQPLRFVATEFGLQISDLEGGFSCTTPGDARAGAGGGQGALAYELQAKRQGWSLRIRRDVTPPGGSPQERAETLLHARALRTPSEVSAFRPATCARWGADAACAGTYPLGQGEAWERVLVLVRGARALVLWETVDPSLGRSLVTELNGRFYGSFRWGGEPRVPHYRPSAYVDDAARLTLEGERIAVELRGALPEDDLLRAEGLLAKVAYSAADPPDEVLEARDRELLGEKLGALGEAAARRLRLELDARVKTPRDLRGLHQVLLAATE